MPTQPIKIRNFIDGEFIEPLGGKCLDNIEPATGKPYSLVPDSEARDVELAVAAAEKAFPSWSKTAAADRSRLLLRIADLIEREPAAVRDRVGQDRLACNFGELDRR
jgi:aminomuconate-semialdehyde/2-hydroxymuconate-6-semialdehyde dehydrogenase